MKLFFFCLQIPHANSIASLVLPHFALGMGNRNYIPISFLKDNCNFLHIFAGIGTLDVALVPLLATIVDSKYIYEDDDSIISSYGSPYGGIYAIQQIRLNFSINFDIQNDI